MGLALDLPALAAFAGITALLIVLYAYEATVGKLVQWIIDHVVHWGIDVAGITTIHPFGFLGQPLQALQNAVSNWIGTLLEANHWLWTHFVRWNAYAWQELSGALSDLAQGTEQTVGWLWRHKVPLLLSGAMGGLWAAIAALRAAIHALPGTVPHIVQPITRTVYRTLPGEIIKVERIPVKVALPAIGALAGEIPLIRRGIDAAEGEADKAIRFAKENVAKLSVAALAGVVVASLLHHLDLGWTRCRGVNRVGKSLCGISGLIESLFLDAVEALVIRDLCWIVESAAIAAAPISSVVTEYGNGINALVRCRGIRQSTGPALTVTALPTPWQTLTFGRHGP